MKILTLHLQNFLSYHDETIDFSALDHAAVSGHNGSGKSSLSDAIAWAIYGSLRVPGDSDSVVNDNASEAVVTLTLGGSDGAPAWQIVRRRNSKSSSGKVALNYYDDGVWRSFGDQSNKTAQAEIDKIALLSKDAFYSLVVMESAAGTRFTQAKGTERRDILLSLVPELDHWSGREATIKSNLAAVTPEAHRLEASIERFTEMTERNAERIEGMREDLASLGDGEPVEDIEAKIETTTQQITAESSGKAAILAEQEAAQADYDRRVEQAEAKADRIDAEIKDAKTRKYHHDRAAERVAERKEALRERRADLADHLDGGIDHESVVSALEKDLGRVETELTEQREKLTLARRLEKESDERIDLLKESETGQCYVCQTPLGEEKVSELIDGAESDLARGQHDHSEATRRIEKLQDKADVLDGKIRRARREAEDFRTKAARLEDAVIGAEEALREAEADREATGTGEDVPSEVDIDRLQDRLDRAEDEIDEINGEWERRIAPEFRRRLEASESDEVDRLTRRLAALKDAKAESQRRQAKRNQIEGAIAELEKQNAELEKQSNLTGRELRGVQQRIEDLRFLLGAFAPRGIPSMLLDGILGEIEDKQNEILAQLPGMENAQVEFRQARENKGGGARDTLDIVVHTGTGAERRFESFSAGERVKLTISNLFAMIAVFNERHPGMIETLFLDEPLGVLDSESVPAFVEVLRVIMGAGIVSTLLVIAHDDRVVEALPQRLMVSRTDSLGSKVAVLG